MRNNNDNSSLGRPGPGHNDPEEGVVDVYVVTPSRLDYLTSVSDWFAYDALTKILPARQIMGVLAG